MAFKYPITDKCHLGLGIGLGLELGLGLVLGLALGLVVLQCKFSVFVFACLFVSFLSHRKMKNRSNLDPYKNQRNILPI